ncbi:MAG: hypothetical protein C3F16_05500 [Betaproteobacteria bacterium]|nr:MAG: hypothetical protein C3F16_05500 [Betaproteobacteria bacterium]
MRTTLRGSGWAATGRAVASARRNAATARTGGLTGGQRSLLRAGEVRNVGPGNRTRRAPQLPSPGRRSGGSPPIAGRRARRPAEGWTLRLVGEPALVSPHGIEHPLERRAAALLALAHLEPGITRRRVAALLWPDSEESLARQALRQQLARLRRVCGQELVQGTTTLRIAEGAVCHASGGPAAAALLGTFDYRDCGDLAQWVDSKRARRQRDLAGQLAHALAALEARGDLDAAIEQARQLVEIEGDDERHHRVLMRLHYLRGDVAQAQATYERLRAMLSKEFDAVPSEETERLARSLRAAGAPKAETKSAAPVSLARPPRLVGREREWKALEAAWHAASAVLVTGVGGMGKTRLVTDFVASRERVAVVAARPGDAFAVHSLLARVVRVLARLLASPLPAGLRPELARLLPELGEAPPIRDDADLSRMLRAVEALLDLAVVDGLEGLVIDDLHHADAASIEALQATIVGDRRVRSIVTGRGDEFGAEARALADALLASSDGRTIELPPLSGRQIQTLLESLDLRELDGAELAASIARHTGGNPLFVLETVKAMLLEGGGAKGGAALPVAGTVTSLIERRLSRLSAEALKIAQCAAVAGQDFSPDLAAHVLGVRPLDMATAWTELEKADVLLDGAFAHDLIHEAALASVPAAIARRLHAVIAAFLAAASGEPGRVAGHWLAARRHKEASAAYLQAAARARETGRRMEEARLLDEAAACFAKCGDAGARFEALLSRAEAMIVVDLGDVTLAAVQAAEEAAMTDDQRLRALLRKAEYLGHRSDELAAVEAGRRGLALAKKARRPDLAVLFSVVVAGGLCELRRVGEALEVLEPLRREGDSGLAPRTRAEYFVQLGIAYDLSNRLSEALGAFEAARAVATEHAFRDILATTLSNLATTTSKRGELRRAVDFGRQGLQLWREAEALRGTPLQTQALLAHRLRDIGHYAEAIAMLEEALAEFRRAGTLHWTFGTAHRLALAYSHVGQHERALKLLAEDPAGLPVKARAIWVAHRAEVARLAGGAALKPIRVALALLGGDVDDGNNRLVSLFAAPIVPAAEGETMAAAVAAWAEARERFGMAVAAHSRAAGCALVLGAVDRALPQVEAALRLFADYEPDNFYRPELWWVAHQVFARGGRVADAARALADGRDWVEHVAAEHVPPSFRESFLTRNPVNRALLALRPASGH